MAGIFAALSRKARYCLFFVFTLSYFGGALGQTFTFGTSEASEILSGADLHAHGFPDTARVWCNDWDYITAHPTNWGNNLKLKSNNTFVKLFVDNYFLLTRFSTPIDYTYRLTYRIYGFNNPADTVHGYVVNSDTLTISFNNSSGNTPFQDLHLKKYNGFFKTMIVYTGLYLDAGGVITAAPLTDVAWQNFKVEGSIVTQHYDKATYGVAATPPSITATPHVANNYLSLSWNFSTPVTPVNYELEWTYIDDYRVTLPGTLSTIPSSSLSYNFVNNSTKVWLDSSTYRLPIIYPRGYLIYRVRAVRPDSVLYKYPIYGDWSYSTADAGVVSAANANARYHISDAYAGDSLNWQYSINFAEGGKYKHVMGFYDGLLKNRQSVTRFNSSLDRLLVTDNVYDFEGQLAIKTLPAALSAASFSYQHDVDLNSVTGLPYRAGDFDTGLAACSRTVIIPPLAHNAQASIYYSNRNPDTTGLTRYNRYIPDAEGYALVHTMFDPGYAGRVGAQGGAGPKLQIGSNAISNAYVSPLAKSLNSLFGPNIGWSSFYTMVVSRDPNGQLSMSVKDFHGKQMVSGMISSDPDSALAINHIALPAAQYFKQDLLVPGAPSQAVDTIGWTKTADVNYFNETHTSDSLQYFYSFDPFPACGKYLSVKGQYNSYISDKCGNILLSQSATLGSNGVFGTSAQTVYAGPVGHFTAGKDKYHVHKTLAINPADVEASLDSLYKISDCFYKQPHFIKESVSRSSFPCTGTDAVDSDDCSKLKWKMMKQLFPGAVYGKYTAYGDSITSTDNSVFSLFCPRRYCYSTRALAGTGTLSAFAQFNDTCLTASSFGVMDTIDFRYNSTSLYFTTFSDSFGSGHRLGILNFASTPDTMYLENGPLTSGGDTVGYVTSTYTTYLGGPVVEGRSVLVIPSFVSSSGSTATITSSLIVTSPRGKTWTISMAAITAVADSPAGACRYRYRDSCTASSLPDTITVGGHLYSNLRTMRVDSFIMVYNGALAEGNYSIAEDLLPLHPQYCELKNCFNDSFRAQVLSVPDWKTAEGLGLLHLDSLVSQDPLKTLMTACGLYPNPADTLRTFTGGVYRLDTFVLINAYCACNDSIMFGECAGSMFREEIASHSLVNAAVKNYYFKNILNAYFSNRQKIVDNLFLRGGSSCSHCAVARMRLDPSAALPPVAVVDSGAAYDSGFARVHTGWVRTMMTDSISHVHDSVVALYYYYDSLVARGVVDTIMAHLSNCTMGSDIMRAKIRDTLLAIHDRGEAPMGNFTNAQIYQALRSNGATFNDICNPYTIDCGQLSALPPKPENDCMPATFFTALSNFINRPYVFGALSTMGMTTTVLTLDTVGNTFERSLARGLGNYNSIKIVSSWVAVKKLYELAIFSPSGSGDTVRVFLHSPVCDNIFATSGCGTFSIGVSCINSSTTLISGGGLVNEYSFIANVSATCSGVATICQMTGWVDSVRTMGHMDNSLAVCTPCTQFRDLYNEFNDTLLTYGIVGVDHPYYGDMLMNFMNVRLGQTYTAPDYLKFVQSCALADSLVMPLYTGYATFYFGTRADMVAFIDTLNGIDSLYSFDHSYRDSSSGGSLRVCVDLNEVPRYELWKYRNTLNSYPPAHYIHRVVNTPFSPPNQIGLVYSDSSYFFNLRDSGIIDTSRVSFFGPTDRYLWVNGHFEYKLYYEIEARAGMQPYEMSRDAYTITSYLNSHNIPGAVFIPAVQNTIDEDYFKPQKQAYLNYTYSKQRLPSYQVVDSLQAIYLPARVTGYASYTPSYSMSPRPDVFTNLYLSNSGMNNRGFDTLQKIIDLAGTSGNIFYSAHRVDISTGGPTRQLTALRCADGSYWYRFFTTGDTMYNVCIAFPTYIPRYLRPSFRVAGPVLPLPGDSLNRSFSLKVVRTGTTDTLMVKGRTDFVISKAIELDNVLLGAAHDGAYMPGVDTFDNCERQTLNSAIREGIVAYNRYMDSARNAISGAFRSYVMGAIKEKLMLGYKANGFDFTLYNYDRAGNLVFTVPPAGSTPITGVGAVLDQVDTCRMNNTPTICPTPTYNKINRYNYNSYNQLTQQVTINGGKTRFFYDLAGRLVFSQNAKQAETGYYTYNLYDGQNRVMETGEAQLGCPYFDAYNVLSPAGLTFCHYTYEGISGLYRVYVITPDPYFVQYLGRGIPHDSVAAFVRSYNRKDVVMTVYDTVARNLGAITGLDVQQNLRARVACVKYFETLSRTDRAFAKYTYATHYSYDPGGNVQSLVQDYPALAAVKQQYKRVDYNYDLISGKVNMLSYNRGWPDQYYQRYSYDADNRITEVNTSGDGLIWKRDAAYNYYEHGPLARVQLGDLRVQGVDYAYTIQGWLKAVNGDTLNRAMEMGQDAYGGSVTAKDAVAFTIDYFKNDYKPITANAVQHTTPLTKSLYNGNISRQTEAINTFQRLSKQYMYDQLNRIGSAAYASVNPATGALTNIVDYRSKYSYDWDGNLQTLVRYGNNAGLGAQLMDSLSYLYASPNNDKLTQLYDNSPDHYTNDLPNYTGPLLPSRYGHDAIGNTVKDLVSGQDTVQWNLYNKVTATSNGSVGNKMRFAYDGAGNRTAKYYTKRTDTGNLNNNNYYVRDAQGNILAIYREREAYGQKPDSWITAAGATAVSLMPSGYSFIRDFVVPEYGASGEFLDAIIAYTGTNMSFQNSLLSRPVSFFLNANKAAYNDMLFAKPDYLPALAAADTQVIGPALSQMALADPGAGATMLAGLLADSAAGAHVLGLLCDVPYGDSVLRTLANAFDETDSLTSLSCDSLKSMLLEDSIDAFSLASAILKFDTAVVESYMWLIARDSVLYGDTALQPFFYTGLQQALWAYGDKGRILSFFDSYMPAMQQLQQVTTPHALLKTVYLDDPAAYLEAYKAVFGSSFVDSAIAAVPGLTYLSYLSGVVGALNLSLDDMRAGTVNVLRSHDFALAEHDIYGSSRLGVKKYYNGQVGFGYTNPGGFVDTMLLWKRLPWYSLEYQDLIKTDSTRLYGNTDKEPIYAQHIQGQKQYELTDHLGDVLVTVSDKRANDSLAGVHTTGSLDTVKSWKPVVASAYDYYPFGQYMPGAVLG